ncbi:MAG: PGPGW domain-containing protein [Cellvibrionaceae bacterium]
MASNEYFLWWVAASSVVVFLASLVVIPWLIVRIPADYFMRAMKHRSTLVGYNPIFVILLKVLRNVVAAVFIIVGLLLLVLPGQGLLTLFLGLVIADFPGKRRAVNWLVARRGIHRSINWLRRRAGRNPINLPPPR